MCFVCLFVCFSFNSVKRQETMINMHFNYRYADQGKKVVLCFALKT